MSIYHEFELIGKVVDISKLKESIEELIVYIKLIDGSSEIEANHIYDWISMLHNTASLFELVEEISIVCNVGNEDIQYIKEKLNEMDNMIFAIFENYKKETGIIIYLQYFYDEKSAYLDFNPTTVLSVVLELFQNKNKTMA